MKADPVSAKGVSIDRLRAFCAVVEAGSITAAVDGDPSRQSQFSRQISELEDAVGTKLFERVNRRLIPTEAGRLLALMTRSYFEGLAELSRIGTSEGETVHIAAAESVFEDLVYPRLASMRAALPGCAFVFDCCSTQDAVQRLKVGRADIAIIRGNAATEDLDTAALVDINYTLVVPRAVLPQGDSSGLDCLRRLPMALLRSGGEFRRSLAAITEKAGIHIVPVAETDTFRGLYELVRTGTVAAILPKSMAKTLPVDKFATVESAEFGLLNRSLVVATVKRTKSLRPLVATAAARMVSVWRP